MVGDCLRALGEVFSLKKKKKNFSYLTNLNHYLEKSCQGNGTHGIILRNNYSREMTASSLPLSFLRQR